MTDQLSPPANATEARGQLDARLADSEWGARVLHGHPEATRELRKLSAKAAETGGDDVVAAVISGKAGQPGQGGMFADSQTVQMAGVAEMFRDLGIADDVTAQFLRGDKVSAAEYQAVKNWKMTAMGDKAPGGFVERYLGGDVTAKQKMLLADSVLVNGYKEVA